MPKPQGAKVWNEDLYEGLRAREDQARAQGKISQYVWRDGALAIRAVRGDIYTFNNGRIVGLPTNLKKTVDNEVRAIITGDRPIFPEGWKCIHPDQRAKCATDAAHSGNPYKKDPYLQKIKMRGGAFAILLAFHYADVDTMTKEQICTAAQPYCDEAMEANFHAGRMRGAWNAKNTLVKHQLLQQNTTHQNAENGWRSNGCWTWTITENGKQFTKAMMEKFNLEEKDGLRQNHTTATAAASTNTATTPSSKAFHFAAAKQSPKTPDSSSKARYRTSELQKLDEKELVEWLVSADVNEQKQFKVGKQRRLKLHGVCARLMQKYPGLILDHISEGEGNARALFVTVAQKDSTVGDNLCKHQAAAAAGSRGAVVSPSPTNAASKVKPFTGAGRTLSEGSPQKKLRLDDANAMAANAAVNRLVSSKSNQGTMLKTNKGNRSPQKRPRGSWLAGQLDLDDSDDSDDSDVEDRKPAALDKPSAQKALIVELLSDSDSESDDDADKYNPKGLTKGTTELNAYSALLASGSLDDPCVLDDSQDSCLRCGLDFNEIKKLKDNARVSTIGKDDPKPKLTILIDDRERDRNVTPRQLRVDLSRLLSSGLLSRVWPSDMPGGEVVERNLGVGDFAFEVNKNQLVAYRLPFLVERKRVGDLVQRSAKGDHWNQLQRMCDICDNTAFLIEGDTGNATQYPVDNGQDPELEWSPDLHNIDDDKSIFRFMGRAVLLSRKTRFIQSKDEQASLRAVGAFGLMASLSFVNGKEPSTAAPVQSKNEQTLCADRLLHGGLPWKLAKRISNEIGSISRVNELYEMCCDSARDSLMCPIIENSFPLPGFENSVTTVAGWSQAVRRVWYSAADDPKIVQADFEKHKDLVQDHGKLLCYLHLGYSVETALDFALSSVGIANLPPRSVHVELSAKLEHCFPTVTGTEQAFYSLTKPATANPLNLGVPTIVMRTQAGDLCSTNLILHVLEGSVIVGIVEDSMSKNGTDFVAAATGAAQEIHLQCHSFAMNLEKDRRILLVHGLNPAIERVAKQAGYRQELLVVIDMLLAAVSLYHDMTVVQAVRKKIEDLQMVVQQLALACFHYYLLTDEVEP